MSVTDHDPTLQEVDDILAIATEDTDEAIHTVQDNADAIFTWDYEKGARPRLNKLYEKAKRSQWNGETDLDWSIAVDQEQLAREQGPMGEDVLGLLGIDLTGTPMAKWSEDEWVNFQVESQNWTLSQFMHGEQGALVCTAKIVETVPWIDAKYYAATQVMDEARHVEVFAKYLDEKMNGHYPINFHLRALLDDIINDTALGHDLSRHADHGRRAGPGRVRHGLPDHDRAAVQAVAQVRDGRRGPSRGLWGAQPQGVLRRAQ